MLFLSKFDDFINSLFKDANGNFDLKIFFALLIGIIIGIVITSSIYGILLLVSLKKQSKKIKLPDVVNDEEILKSIETIKKDYINLTSGFQASEKMQVLGTTLINTVKTVAAFYYPNSKYPLYELNINELIILTQYISQRVDGIFDKAILKYFKNVSISQIMKLLDLHRGFQNNKVVKTVKKINPVSKVIVSVLNIVNPIYWIRKFIINGTISLALDKMALIVIDITSEETINIYSKRLFNQQNNLLKEDIEKAILDLEEMNEKESQ